MKPMFRKTRSSKLILAGLILLTTCGCNAVISKRPVGEKPAKIVAKVWEGNWVTADGAVFSGKLDGDDVILDELKPQHLKIITSGERGVLFDWDKPLVFVKVGN